MNKQNKQQNNDDESLTFTNFHSAKEFNVKIDFA